MTSAVERGLTDTGREASAAASMLLAAASRPESEAAAGAALACDRCGLVIKSRTAALAPRYCPRCLARRRIVVHLQPLEIGRGDSVTPLRLSLQLPASDEAPGIARRRVVERFHRGLEHRELEEARLLTSELVTNAVVHGRGTVELIGLLDEDRLMIEVTDQGNGFERAVREHGLDAVGGHGLNIVDALASRWGIDQGIGAVWFELERAGPRLGPAVKPEG